MAKSAIYNFKNGRKRGDIMKKNKIIIWIKKKVVDYRLWVAICAVIGSVLYLRGQSHENVEQIKTLVMSAASIIALLVGDGFKKQHKEEGDGDDSETKR